MSRSGLSDDCDEQWMHALWRGRVSSATRGRRGQRFFKELLAALDAMPDKRLEANTFDEGPVTGGDTAVDGGVCALGALARHKGIDVTDLDPEDSDAAEELAGKFDIADCLAREVIWMNDEHGVNRWTPLEHGHLHGVHSCKVLGDAHDRWVMVRDWVEKQITKEPAP